MLKLILGLSLMLNHLTRRLPLYQKRIIQASTMPPPSTRPFWSSNAYDHNPQWTAVDAFALTHLHPPSRANSDALSDTLIASDASGLPDYNLPSAQAKFLALHCRTAGVTHALEIGTLGGYTALWLASENSQLRVTSIEYRRKHVDVARQNIARAGLADRIEVIHGSGLDVLSQLSEEVSRGARPMFGFVFIDADKENNWNYFQLARGMVCKNAVVCVDNIVREGRLADTEDDDAYVLASREVVSKVGKEPGVDSVVLQMVGEKEGL